MDMLHQIFRSADSCQGNPFADLTSSISFMARDKYTQIFQSADSMKAGFLTGEQAKKVFMKSGLSKQVLDQIWHLANLDDHNVGLEKFLFAMYLINLARLGLLTENSPFSSDLTKLKAQMLLIERKSLSEYVNNLKKKISENIKAFEKNGIKKSTINNHIQQHTSFIRKNKISIEKMQRQIEIKQAFIARLQTLLEHYHSEISISEEQHMQLNHLDKFDSRCDDLLSVANDKKNDVSKLINEFEALKISIHDKSSRLELLRKDTKKKIEQNLRSDSLQLNFFNEDEMSYSGNLCEANHYKIIDLRGTSINELVLSEEAYLNDLQVIFEVFYDAIKREDFFSEDELNEVFLNLEDIVLCSENFLRALKIRLGRNNQRYAAFPVGDIILDHLKEMDSYIVFCSFQHRQAMLLQERLDSNPKFNQAHQRLCQHEKASGLSLSSFLLKPIQRVTRYPLLTEKILSSTTHKCKDFSLLEMAKNKAVELCNLVNEASRKQQNHDYLDIIQCRVQYDDRLEKLNFNSETNCLGPRKYLYSGLLYKVKNSRELMGLLFTDFLLLTLPSKPIGHSTTIISPETKPNILFKAYKDPILLNEMTAILDDVTCASFKIIHKNKTFHLKALSKVERDSWIRNIDSASRCYLDFEKKKKTKTDILKTNNSVGRLFVRLQEGVNLQLNSGDNFLYCKVQMGVQEQKSRTIPGNLNPNWNFSMQFYLFDIEEDVLHIEILAKKNFSKDVLLGWAEITTYDIAQEIQESKQPIIKHLLLHGVDSGEIIIKLDLQLYASSLAEDDTNNLKQHELNN